MFINSVLSKFSFRLNKEKNEPEKATSPIKAGEEKRLESSLDALAVNSAAEIRMKSAIPPKKFNSVYSESNYKPAVRWGSNVKYKYVEKMKSAKHSSFKKNLNPIILEKERREIDTYDICNFSHPGGTIAISRKIRPDKAISTSGLLQCAGIAFVDRKKGIQTLLHLCPTINKKDNDDLIHYILSHSKPEDLEITIAPGCYDETDNTVSYFLDAIGEYKNKSKVIFANFPDSEDDTLILQNGKLKCSDGKNIRRRINPNGKLIHAGMN